MTGPPARLAFAGVGWIGRLRLQGLVQDGLCRPVAYYDPDDAAVAQAQQIAAAPRAESFDGLFEHDLDGVVVATPSGLHAQQCRAALEHGQPVFCQKPLARDRDEAQRAVEAAADADRLLAVDWSYRGTRALRKVRDGVRAGVIGTPYAVDLTFHNAYGPDRPWYYDRAASGGGCLLDLGSHLVDALHWVLPGRRARVASARLYARGRPLREAGPTAVEDHAMVHLDVGRDGGVGARLACSWKVPSGGDAHVELTFYGTEGALRMRNVGGSYFDFVAERLHGTRAEPIEAPPDAWGHRQAAQWVRRVAGGRRAFADEAWTDVATCAALEEVYRCAS